MTRQDQDKRMRRGETGDAVLKYGILGACGILIISMAFALHRERDRTAAVCQKVSAAPFGDTMRLDGNGNGLYVDFSHARHTEIASQDGRGCPLCHHLPAARNKTAPCSRCHGNMVAESSMFDHQLHAGIFRSRGNCDECHPGGDRSREKARACGSCHGEYPMPSAAYLSVSSFQWALHRRCRECHNRRGVMNGSALSMDCYFCHK
ncbi:MAG: hypothetical protein JXA20_04355 [Spirochaetes bacterium]|nr:hypothetical protein [Spirochaetota bacterium]